MGGITHSLTPITSRASWDAKIEAISTSSGWQLDRLRPKESAFLTVLYAAALMHDDNNNDDDDDYDNDNDDDDDGEDDDDDDI